MWVSLCFGLQADRQFDVNYDKIIEKFFRGHFTPEISLLRFCLKSRFWRRAVNFRISTPRLVPLTLHALSDETSEIPIPVHFYKTGEKFFYSANTESTPIRAL